MLGRTGSIFEARPLKPFGCLPRQHEFPSAWYPPDYRHGRAYLGDICHGICTNTIRVSAKGMVPIAAPLASSVSPSGQGQGKLKLETWICWKGCDSLEVTSLRFACKVSSASPQIQLSFEDADAASHSLTIETCRLACDTRHSFATIPPYAHHGNPAAQLKPHL